MKDYYRIWIMINIYTIASCTFPQGQPPKDETDLYVLFHDQYQTGNYKQALISLDSILKITPDISISIYIDGYTIYQKLAEEANGSRKDSLLIRADELIKLGNKYFGHDLNNFTIEDLPLTFVAKDAFPKEGLKQWIRKIRLELNRSGCRGGENDGRAMLVELIIERDGTISSINIYNSELYECAGLLIKLINKTDSWCPAEHDGKKVRQLMVLSI